MIALRSFGSLCFPCLYDYSKYKLQLRSIECTLSGHASQHRGYLCLDKAKGRLYKSRYVVFDETRYSILYSSTPFVTDEDITHCFQTFFHCIFSFKLPIGATSQTHFSHSSSLCPTSNKESISNTISHSIESQSSLTKTVSLTVSQSVPFDTPSPLFVPSLS